MTKQCTHAKIIAAIDALPKTAGQAAYEADLRWRPNYDGGKPRKTWDQLGDLARSTWERNPTPRGNPE